MPVTITDPSNAVRNKVFTETITPEGESVTSIVCTPVDIKDSGITISTSSSTITLSGSYEDAFDQDKIKSFPVGKSVMLKEAEFDEEGNITIEERELTTAEFEVKKQQFPDIVQPTISTSFTDVPSDHTVFSTIQDNRETITKSYNATVTYTDATTNAEVSQSLTFNHIVDTDITAFANKIRELYPSDASEPLPERILEIEVNVDDTTSTDTTSSTDTDTTTSTDTDTDTTTSTGISTNYLIAEDGNVIIKENSDYIILEQVEVVEDETI